MNGVQTREDLDARYLEATTTPDGDVLPPRVWLENCNVSTEAALAWALEHIQHTRDHNTDGGNGEVLTNGELLTVVGCDLFLIGMAMGRVRCDLDTA